MRTIILLLLLFTCFSAESRQHIVADAQTRDPIPFSTITIANSGLEFSADSTGRFSYSAILGDMVVVSAIGYIGHTYSVPEMTDTLFLTRYQIDLDSVFVKESRNPKVIYLGVPFKKKLSLTHAPFPNNFEIGQRFDLPDKNTYKLKRLIIPIERRNGEAKIIVHVYKMNPGDSISGEEVLVTVVPIGKLLKSRLVVDCSNEGIFFNNDSSFLLSVTWLPDRKNASDGPGLLLLREPSEYYYRYNSISPIWQKPDRTLNWWWGTAFAVEIIRK